MAYTTINKSTDHFNTVAYTGTGSTRSITALDFQPDWVWFKGRSFADAHYIYDAVRGVGNGIYSHSTAAQSYSSTTLTAFNSDGFTVGSEGGVNGNGQNLVSWNWKANGAGSSNTDGSITSTVSANTTAGFSIVKWYGTGANATIGHGLGVAPSVVITKNLDASANWIYGGDNIGWTKYLIPNLTNTVATANNAWNDTAPNSTVVSLGSSTVTNASANMIAYCFAEKTGYSKFGVYTGNGSSNGTFIYTGFKPVWFMIKNTGAAENWNIGDNKRNITYPAGANVNNAELSANTSNAEGDRSTRGGGITQYDMLSNGIKLRGSNPETGAGSGSYIYMAFGQTLVGSNNVPCTAR